MDEHIARLTKLRESMLSPHAKVFVPETTMVGGGYTEEGFKPHREQDLTKVQHTLLKSILNSIGRPVEVEELIHIHNAKARGPEKISSPDLILKYVQRKGKGRESTEGTHWTLHGTKVGYTAPEVRQHKYSYKK